MRFLVRGAVQAFDTLIYSTPLDTTRHHSTHSVPHDIRDDRDTRVLPKSLRPYAAYTHTTQVPCTPRPLDTTHSIPRPLHTPKGLTIIRAPDKPFSSPRVISRTRAGRTGSRVFPSLGPFSLLRIMRLDLSECPTRWILQDGREVESAMVSVSTSSTSPISPISLIGFQETARSRGEVRWSKGAGATLMGR